MKKIVLKIVLFLFLSAFFIIGTPVLADSGWDYDYDTSGFDSYDYDVDTGESSDGTISGTSSGGGMGRYSWLSIPLAVSLAVAAGAVSKKKNKNRNTFIPEDNNKVENIIFENGNMREERDTVEHLEIGYDSVIQKYLPDYTEEKLLKELYDRFVTIQKAWMDFDYKTLEENCSNTLYDSYHSDLETLKEKKEKNIMKEFTLISSNIRNIEERDGKVYIDMYLFVSFYDYVVDEKDNLIRGNKDAPVRNAYDLEYVYEMSGLENCPSCGAKLTGKECSSCHTIVEAKKEKIVLNQKGIMRN